jgi:hypothetical protein
MTFTIPREAILRGNLSQISLSEILLLAIDGKKSGLLKLSRGKETVEIFLDAGDITHARCSIGEGEKALLYPVTWGEGTFVLGANGAPHAQTIDRESSELLAEVKAMSQEWEEILQVIPTAKTVFRIADPEEEQNGSVNIPHTGWRVLSKIDGQRNVQTIADLLRLPCAYTAKVIYNLYKSGLVEIVSPAAKDAAEIMSAGFFDRLISELTDVIGPMASIIVQDQIASLGESTDAFPKARLEELIELISNEILDESSKTRFQEQMFGELQTLKAL